MLTALQTGQAACMGEQPVHGLRVGATNIGEPYMTRLFGKATFLVYAKKPSQKQRKLLPPL